MNIILLVHVVKFCVIQEVFFGLHGLDESIDFMDSGGQLADVLSKIADLFFVVRYFAC